MSYANSVASPLSATITTNPSAAVAVVADVSSVSKQVGQTHMFSSSATRSDGGTLSYQWQVSTDTGSTWSDISGQTTYQYTTSALVIGDNAKQYRLAVTNSKNGTNSIGYSSAGILSVSQTTLGTPVAPTGVAVAGSAVSLTISFTGVGNSTSHTARIYLASDTATALQTLTGFSNPSTISGLTANTGYVVSITAVGDGVSYANSVASPLSATITTNRAQLPTPNAPTAGPTANTHKSLDITWSAISHATTYVLKLYLSDGQNIVKTLTGLTTTSKTFNASDYASIAEATGYKVSIKAIGDSQYIDSAESALSSLATTITADATSPTISSQPSGVTKLANQTANFSVTAASPDGGTLSYQWQLSTNAGVAWAVVSTGSGGTTSSYTTATLPITANGYQYRVVVTNTYSGSSSTTTSTAASLVVNKANQSTLSITSRDGILGTPLTLAVSGGSSSGAVTYSVANGSATGCSLASGVLTVSTTGTCSVTATMASNETYNVVSSSATAVNFIATAQSVGVSVSNTVGYQSGIPITVVVGTAGKVTFFQNGKKIPGCVEVRASVTSAATCSWKPTTLGDVTITAEITPTNTNIPATISSGMTVRVTER